MVQKWDVRRSDIVVALPRKAYNDLSKEEAIRKYEKMCIKDFEKQFETDTPLEFSETYIRLYMNGRFANIVRKVAPFTVFKTWHGKDAKGSAMASTIYTELDGYPFAEYCAVWDKAPFMPTIADDLAAFYKKHGWRAYTIDGKTAVPFGDAGNQEYSLEAVEPPLLSMILAKLKK